MERSSRARTSEIASSNSSRLVQSREVFMASRSSFMPSRRTLTRARNIKGIRDKAVLRCSGLQLGLVCVPFRTGKSLKEIGDHPLHREAREKRSENWRCHRTNMAHTHHG